MGQLSRDATRQSRQLCVMADKWVAAPATPQQLTYAAGGTSILVLSGRRVKKSIKNGEHNFTFSSTIGTSTVDTAYFRLKNTGWFLSELSGHLNYQRNFSVSGVCLSREIVRIRRTVPTLSVRELTDLYYLCSSDNLCQCINQRPVSGHTSWSSGTAGHNIHIQCQMDTNTVSTIQ